jgi:uncharacterized protein involved in type VI secretion and phage assembly
MIGATEFRAGALDKRYYGVVVGIIADNVDPKEQGRVQVRFPWYDNQTVTDWCRVVYPYAGPSYGFIAVPEKKSECLVGFEFGDMRRPYVLGGLFNGVDKPPVPRKKDEDKDEKHFRTRGGHRFVMRDTKQATEIELHSSGGHHLSLRDQGKNGAAVVTLKTSGGELLEMDDGAGKITISTGAGQTVVLESGKVTVTASEVTLSATTVKLGPAASQKVILGDAFMALFNAHVHTSTAPTFPTSPPVTPMLPVMLSNVTKTT